jgi:hypothetical protein
MSTDKICCQVKVKKKGKAIPLTGRGGVEVSRLPYFLDNRFTEGGEVVGFTRRPPFTPRKILGTHFILEVESTPGP